MAQKDVEVKTYVEQIDKLIPNKDNPRKIDRKAYDQLKQSLKDFPEMKELREIVVDENMNVLGGHQRLFALKDMGYKDVLVKQVIGLSASKKREFIIKDNTASGEWDDDIIAASWDLDELNQWGIPDDVLNKASSDVSNVEEDEAPEVDEANTVSKLGEIYQLGKHRLMCGDGTSGKDIGKLLGGAKVALVYTDPPYGVSYESKTLGGIENDDLAGDDLSAFIYDSFRAALPHLSEEAGVYCWYEDRFRHLFQQAIERAGYEFKQNLIWNKGMNLSGADYQKAHENCMYFQIEGKKAAWYGGRDKKTILGKKRSELEELSKDKLLKIIMNLRKEQTVWDYDRDDVQTYVHPTQKPVVMTAQAIGNSSKPGDNVLDMFAGSGSTLMAAEQTDRICYTMELDPKFCDVIRKRYWKHINDGSEVGWEAGTESK